MYTFSFPAIVDLNSYITTIFCVMIHFFQIDFLYLSGQVSFFPLKGQLYTIFLLDWHFVSLKINIHVSGTHIEEGLYR